MCEKKQLSQEEIKKRWRILCIGAGHLPNKATVAEIFLHYRYNVPHRNSKILFQYALIGMGFASPDLQADGVVGRETQKSLQNLYDATGLTSG
ncbi:hypothetical protein A2442_02870 [Candidatus Campbellbacteria bacterium RIFOXYC2_FULL_35_25]|uniref:Uncharacterized protein n=1 Tax=Candidatus Campbellbacteria bacterium RIFOXYC2_FULL_35_25 TaxID=1797582 RepID=A0A1F5EJM6_9BACT|nr:MAG: hypothetical protein A2442_02870 [Candidatus Campbellbacteria bacterium RIFOXYC2_FULL_35_25]